MPLSGAFVVAFCMAVLLLLFFFFFWAKIVYGFMIHSLNGSCPQTDSFSGSMVIHTALKDQIKRS